MTPSAILIAYQTMIRKEIVRIFRIWTQTLLPSVITMALYYAIFGKFVGSQIEAIGAFTYIQFIVPGLVMMAVITNSFSNVVSTFFGAKFQKNIEEIIVSPTPSWVVIAGFVSGGVIRGFLVGILVLLTSLFFTKLVIFNLGIISLFMFLTSLLFALGGLINGIFAKTFDGTAIIPTFVLTPLTYLGGVFYSINLLPSPWRSLSLANPILYLVNGFRYGFLGITDVSIGYSIALLIILCAALLSFALFLFRKGYALTI
jgi:ABC-2 type transport system permease protein